MSITNKANYNFPTRIRYGAGCVAEAGEFLSARGFKKPLLVADPGLVKLPVYARVAELLIKSGLVLAEFSTISKNPVKSNVSAGVETYKKNNADCIIGLGGGASIDTARAIALWVNHENHDLFDFDDSKGGDKYVVNAIPFFITIPTTSGTGSEVGRSTVIADDITHEKKILFSPELMPKQVFADPELTYDLPPFITAATGLDALTHNLEAYLAKGFSPLCDGVAIEGIRLVLSSLDSAVNRPTGESRARMQMAALMGATAFQKGLGIVHSMAHPLSTVYDMHHGLANAIMLSYGMQFNASVCEKKFSRIISYCSLNMSPLEFPDYLKEFNVRVGLPVTLKGQIPTFTDADQKKLGELALADPCHGSNEKAVTEFDFRELYVRAYNG